MGMLKKTRGFSLIELLLVLTIFGIALAMIVPRAFRAQNDAKFGQVRQQGSEIAGYVMAWAADQVRAQQSTGDFTLVDFITKDIFKDSGAGFESYKLIDKYTGNKDFSGVYTGNTLPEAPKNPFDDSDYFSKDNDDNAVPSHRPGLLYLAGQPDPEAEDYLNLYFVITDKTGGGRPAAWYEGMNPSSPKEIRKGIYVARLYYGGVTGAGKQWLGQGPGTN